MAAIAVLSNSFTHTTSRVLECETSAGSDTSKLLLQLQSGQKVEAVIMHYDTTGRQPQMLPSMLRVRFAGQAEHTKVVAAQQAI